MLREIYLRVFELIFKQGQPATVMHSYNKLNGNYTGESAWLLTDILRKEWGYKGLVLSDWLATIRLDRSMETEPNFLYIHVFIQIRTIISTNFIINSFIFSHK